VVHLPDDSTFKLTLNEPLFLQKKERRNFGALFSFFISDFLEDFVKISSY
tara:strand:- start:188 stop:337 length:150 start_codon:yes stop_codon:yes gene_type:complete